MKTWLIIPLLVSTGLFADIIVHKDCKLHVANNLKAKRGYSKPWKEELAPLVNELLKDKGYKVLEEPLAELKKLEEGALLSLGHNVLITNFGACVVDFGIHKVSLEGSYSHSLDSFIKELGSTKKFTYGPLGALRYLDPACIDAVKEVLKEMPQCLTTPIFLEARSLPWPQTEDESIQ